MLKFNLFILCLEFYTTFVLLFEVKLPGTEAINDNPTTKLTISFLPLVFTILSKYVEGWSPITIPTFLCSAMIPVGAILQGLPKLGFAVLVTLLAITHLKMIKDFPLKGFLQSTGPLRVGYKSYKDKNSVIYSVFYPTLNPTSTYPKFVPDDDAWRKYREIAQGGSNFPPNWLFDILTHFCTKLNMPAHIDAPLVSSHDLKARTFQDKFIPLIFSHGLGASRHNYASTLMQLASQGYFVISMDHQDDVKGICIETEKKTRVYLERRVNEIKQMINEIYSHPDTLGRLFNEKIEFDLSRLTLMGHSFGGASVYSAACQDERVKHCVLLDPWLTPVQKEVLENKLRCSLLLLESGNWNEKNPTFNITKSNLTVMEAQKENELGAIYCKIPNSSHNNFSDDLLVVGGIMKFLKIIEDIDKSAEIYRNNVNVIDNYYNTVISRKQPGDHFIRYIHDEKYPLKKYS